MDNNSTIGSSVTPNEVLIRTTLDKELDGSIVEQTVAGRATAEDAVIFTQESAGSLGIITTSVLGGGGYFQKSTSDGTPAKQIRKDTFQPKYTRVINFDMDMPITRTFMEDNQLSAVQKAIRQTANQWKASRDLNAFGSYALGFTTALTIDGASLFSNTHTNANGDTVDNLETGAMSDTTIYNTVISLTTQIDQSGVLIGYEPNFLLTSRTSHASATQITKSVLRAGGSAASVNSNDLNYYSELYPGMEVKYSPFLEANGNSIGFYMGAKGHSVTRFTRESLNTTLVPWQYNLNSQYMYRLRAREAVDTIDYLGIVGCAGS
jgi:hypothetical protein